MICDKCKKDFESYEMYHCECGLIFIDDDGVELNPPHNICEECMRGLLYGKDVGE